VAFLHGRALDALPAFSPEAEALLTRSLKLDPSSVDAWNALGHCFWKKRDYGAAVSCYNDSHKRRPNAEALRSLSQLVRQASRTSESLADSIAKAKAAIALDVRDADSWSTLGAASLIHYIAGSRHPDDLLRANKAYARAAQLEAAAAAAAAGGSVGDPAAARNPDLHYNRAQVLQYAEEFEEAVASFELASSIDPCLEGRAAAEGIRRYVVRVHDAIARHGNVKPKRVKDLATALAEPLAGLEAERAGAARKPATLASLKEGPNAGVYLRLRSLLPVVKSDQPPP
jgi:tetratricopeptide (TPR) repeat protein